MDYLESVPIIRKELIQFTEEIELLNPGIKFDYGLMNKLKHKNLWFIDILEDADLALELEQQILKDGQKDSDDISKILKVMKQTGMNGNGIEGNNGVYHRA